MEQLCFVPETGQSKNLPVDMMEYTPSLFGQQESDALLSKIIAETAWKQRIQTIWGKQVLTPPLLP